MNWALATAVMIQSTVSNGNLGTCSGVLLSDHRVLTAAHCVQNNRNFTVSLYDESGALWGTRTGMNPEIQKYYRPGISLTDNDLGSLDLRIPLFGHLPFSYLPICQNYHQGDSVLRVGFGGRANGNPRTSFLLVVKGITPNRLSAYTDDPQSVHGDSGGPLYAFENGTQCIFAIHSTLTFPATTAGALLPGSTPIGYDSLVATLIGGLVPSGNF